MEPVGVREIPLTRGLVALVDAADFEWLSQSRWYAMKCGTHFYAARTVWTGAKTRHLVLMHRVITGCAKGQLVDHADGNTLDDRRANLRVCSHAENSRNRAPRRLLKGVSKSSVNRWSAAIGFAGRKHRLGSFKSPEEAARAYDQAAVRLHGDFARLNFPEAA